MTTVIKCSFCDSDYDSDTGHECVGNSVAPPYRRRELPEIGIRIPAPGESRGYARELLTEELTKLKDERVTIDMDYEAYKLVHDPMVASLVEALGKL